MFICCVFSDSMSNTSRRGRDVSDHGIYDRVGSISPRPVARRLPQDAVGREAPVVRLEFDAVESTPPVAKRPTEYKHVGSLVGSQSVAEQGRSSSRPSSRSTSPPMPRGSSLDRCDVATLPRDVDTLLRATQTRVPRIEFLRHFGVVCENPQDADAVSACCADVSRGTHVAWGQRNGTLLVYDREEGFISTSQQVPDTTHPFRRASCTVGYKQFVDPLSSEEVLPQINAVALLPQNGPTVMLLTANAKVPKLWKIVTTSALAPPFRAVDHLGTGGVDPLTHKDDAQGVFIKEFVKYKIDHDHNIHSLCVPPDARHFYSCDELCVRLWSFEHPHNSLDVGKIAEPGDAKESITVASIFPNEPSLLFLGTTAGNIRVCDLRQGLRLVVDPKLGAATLCNPPRHVDGPFACVTNSILGMDLSPCGRIAAARDFMTVALFDLRKVTSAPSSSGHKERPYQPSPNETLTPNVCMSETSIFSPLIRRWVLHPFLAPAFEELYQRGTLFEKNSVRFLSDGQHLITGSVGSSVHVLNAMDGSAEVDLKDVRGSATLALGREEKIEGMDQLCPQDAYESAEETFAASTQRRFVIPPPDRLRVAEQLDFSAICSVHLGASAALPNSLQESDYDTILTNRVVKLAVLPGRGSRAGDEVFVASGGAMHHVALGKR